MLIRDIDIRSIALVLAMLVSIVEVKASISQHRWRLATQIQMLDIEMSIMRLFTKKTRHRRQLEEWSLANQRCQKSTKKFKSLWLILLQRFNQYNLNLSLRSQLLQSPLSSLRRAYLKMISVWLQTRTCSLSHKSLHPAVIFLKQ